MLKNYNIALVPADENIADALEEFSQDLRDELGSTYVLGPQSHAHISLLQFEAPERIEDELKAAIAAYPFEGIYVHGTGFYFGPTRKVLWYGISLHLNEALVALQADLHQRTGEIRLKNSFGDKFNPHFTLGRTEMRDDLPQIPLNHELTVKQDILCQLALGVSGAGGQLVEILAKK